jgi:uncharacterized membrane protein YsdA (DUF1294 family)
MNLLVLITLPHIIAALLIINIGTFILFGIDKLRAEASEWRISESTLLFWAFFGGLIGAYCGRAMFRHKTRKQPFCSHLQRTAIIHAILAAAGVGLWFG